MKSSSSCVFFVLLVWPEEVETKTKEREWVSVRRQKTIWFWYGKKLIFEREKIDTHSADKYTLQQSRSSQTFWFAFLILILKPTKANFFFFVNLAKKFPFFSLLVDEIKSSSHSHYALLPPSFSVLGACPRHHLFWTKISTMIYFLYVQHTTKPERRSVQ